MRTTPYKDVTRAKCERCGERGEYEWSGVCAERKGRVVYHALCRSCDVELNRMALTFVYGAQRARQMMRRYE